MLVRLYYKKEGRDFVYFQNGNIGLRRDFAAVLAGFLTFQLAEFFARDVVYG
jgi:hypothetical protein